MPLCLRGFPGSSDSKESACNAGNPGLIPGSRRLPRKKECLPTPVFLPDNSMNRGAWWAVQSTVANI